MSKIRFTYNATHYEVKRVTEDAVFASEVLEDGTTKRGRPNKFSRKMVEKTLKKLLLEGEYSSPVQKKKYPIRKSSKKLTQIKHNKSKPAETKPDPEPKPTKPIVAEESSVAIREVKEKEPDPKLQRLLDLLGDDSTDDDYW